MAQLNRTSWKNLYGLLGTIFPDNTTSEISESDMRTFGENLADSFLNKSNDLIDDDTFATASSTTVPSSESVKAYVDAQASGLNSVDLYSRIFDDFNTGPAGYMNLQAFSTGGGSGAVPGLSSFGCDSTEQCSGVMTFGTATSTNGGSGLINVTYTHLFGNSFQYTLSYRVALSALSDGTDTYTIRIGFVNTFSSTPTSGAYFRYTHGTNSGKWEAVTVDSGVETAEDTGITADISTFHIFKVVANAAGTQIDFYIDGVKTNDITTNIPSAVFVGQSAVIHKTAGSTSRTMYMDYFEFITERTTAR